MGAYGSVLLLRGRLGIATAASDNSNTCAENGSTSQNTNSLVSTIDPGLKLVFSTNSSSAPSTLLDVSELVEEGYDGTGIIVFASYAAGGSLTYTYSSGVVPSISPAAGLLLAVTDNFGRSVQFAYEQPNAAYLPRISSITAPDGALVTAGYDLSNNLISLGWDDSTARIFRYEKTGLPWAMTGITDESTRNFSTYTYDTAGRAIGTRLGLSADSYSVTYSSPPMWAVTETVSDSLICRIHHWVAPVGTTVTDPVGNSRAMGAVSEHGMTFLSSTTSPAGSGSAVSGRQMTYDANGNLTSDIDLNGNLTCLAYDTTRDLMTSFVEGLPASKGCPTNLSSYSPMPADAAHPERKTITVWHPNWALKVQEAAPKKIMTWVYNGQPDPIAGTTASCVSPVTTLPDGKPLAVLCTRYEQATTDTTGALGLSATIVGATRAWIYTYNQYGQVLTETTPKQSSTDVLSHTTSYLYYPTTSFVGSVGHTMGDLNTVTNPLNQVTTFTSYDKAGRLLSSKDANSTVTAITYWPRGWLHTQRVTPASGSALATTYDYWPTGLLKTVTLPDASTLNYAYDDAHRLTDVTDAAGNKMHYVLDNTGNRTSEQVTDASGQLASSIARVYDQLNRVQSTTGAMH
jgi:YD repeat-containing protein